MQDVTKSSPSLRLRCLFAIEARMTETLNKITFIIMYVLNPGHSLEEVRGGKCDHEGAIGLGKDPMIAADREVVDLLAMEVRRQLSRQDERHAGLDEKSKVLLTMTGVLLAANTAVLPQLPVRWLGLLPIAGLLTGLFLLLRYFKTGSYTVVDLETIEWKDEIEAKRQVAIEESKVAADLWRRCDFLIGVQRSAYRVLLLSLAAEVLVLATVTFWPLPSNASAGMGRGGGGPTGEPREPVSAVVPANQAWRHRTVNEGASRDREEGMGPQDSVGMRH